MIRNFILIAVRNLKRNLVFSAINIFGLSLGLACCMLIYLYTLDEVSFDRFHKNGPQLYRISVNLSNPEGKLHQFGYTGMMPGPAFKHSIPDVESYVRYQSEYLTVRNGNELFDQEAAYADETFFQLFSFPLVSGVPEKSLSDPQSVVLSASMAKKYFGSTNAVGKTLELKLGDTFQPYQVSAVMQDAPQNSSIKPQLLLPLKFAPSQNDKHWMNFFLHTFVLLKPGADIAKVETQMNRVFMAEAAEELAANKQNSGMEEKVHYGLQAFESMHLDTVYQADNGLVDASNPMYTYILSGIALLILVVACINFVNLTLGQALKRSREIGIRKAMGSQRSQLVTQFLGEALVLCSIAFLLAVGMVITVLPYFNTLANKALSFSYLLDAKLIFGYGLLLFATALLAGFYPALVLSGFNPVQTLYGKAVLSGRSLLAKGMVVFQFTLATFLIMAVITMYSQFNYLTNYNLGYNDKGVLSVNTERMDKQKLNLFRNELLKNSAIQQVAADQGGFQFSVAHINQGSNIEYNIRYIDEQYFPLFDIPVVKGRNFSSAMTTDTSESVIVNESFVKTAGWKDPIGQEVDFFWRNKKCKVIGVIRDYHFESLTEEMKPQLFTADPEMKFSNVYLRVAPGALGSAQAHLSSVFKSFFPAQAYNPRFKDQENLQAYEAEAKWKTMISMGAVLTIIISCIGLLGLATITAQKRTKEIGIRKVLGASVSGIVSMLTSDFLRMVGLAVLIGFPLAGWAIGQWLQNYPYRIEMKWWMYGLAGLLVMMVAFFTIGWQTLQAARSNPVKSLKSE
ncbi:ABC transporter permease [Flavihumibacter stibioxidans]|uniref:Antibiotic ABC transporter permease n=1 Tax=Flavihumibacter stibioxidans TaxID=1834163 RepID=A0ABR7M5E8_9BACT|nr:ABC transporter permease [Flavihumibacter stibioxidans]MBC6489891.1 antibiotic ABC transporter permease [Flavihumibacter stibioxidans]